MRAHQLAACLVFASLSVAAGLRAQTAPPAATTSSALPLELELGGSKLEAESVRKAVELELKRPVVLEAAAPGAASLSVIAHANRTVTVSYRSSTGVTRTRSISIPEDSARGAEVIALLSGNLSRDEAAELLAALAAKNAASATATAEASAGSEALAAPTATKPDEPPKATAAETPPPPERAPPSSETPLLETPFPAFNLSLVAPTTLYRNSEQRMFAGELGLVYSHVGALRGVGVNMLVLRTERDMRGASFASFYNFTGGTLTGIAGSALVNRRHRLRGVAFAGLLNLGSADARGVSAAGLANREQEFVGLQAAGLGNWATRFEGLQAAGLGNWATRFEGLQAAGLGNWADRFEGLQLAGILNRARAFTGLQAAGVVNIAQSISGLQLGVVNVAGDVHGLQLGVVNVAKRVTGTSIGLVSVADNGRVQPVLWASSAQLLNAAVKFSVGPFYTQAGLGYAPGDQTYTYELGLGGHIPIGRFFIEPGVHYSEMRSTEHPFDHALIEHAHYRVAAGLDLGKVSPFGGVGILQRFAHSADAPASQGVSLEMFGGAAFF